MITYDPDMESQLKKFKAGFLRWMRVHLNLPMGLQHFPMRGHWNIVDLATGQKTEFCETQDDYQYGLPCEGGWTYWEDGTTTFSWNCWFCGRRLISEEIYDKTQNENRQRPHDTGARRWPTEDSGNTLEGQEPRGGRVPGQEDQS